MKLSMESNTIINMIKVSRSSMMCLKKCLVNSLFLNKK